MSNFTPVEEVLNIYDMNRVWYPVYGYNGYEVSNDKIVRSMKHYKKYPYGLLIKPIKDTDNYVLSDDNNCRKTLSVEEIYQLGITNPFNKSSNYPRPTAMTDGNPRNDRHFIKKEKLQRDPQLDKKWTPNWGN